MRNALVLGDFLSFVLQASRRRTGVFVLHNIFTFLGHSNFSGLNLDRFPVVEAFVGLATTQSTRWVLREMYGRMWVNGRFAKALGSLECSKNCDETISECRVLLLGTSDTDVLLAAILGRDDGLLRKGKSQTSVRTWWSSYEGGLFTSSVQLPHSSCSAASILFIKVDH